MRVTLTGMTPLFLMFLACALMPLTRLWPLLGPQGTLAAALLGVVVGVLARRFITARVGAGPAARHVGYLFLIVPCVALLFASIFIPQPWAALVTLTVDLTLAVWWWDQDRWKGLGRRVSAPLRRPRVWSRPSVGH